MFSNIPYFVYYIYIYVSWVLRKYNFHFNKWKGFMNSEIGRESHRKSKIGIRNTTSMYI